MKKIEKDVKFIVSVLLFVVLAHQALKFYS